MTHGVQPHGEAALDPTAARLVDGLEQRTAKTSREVTDAIFFEIPIYAERLDERFYADVLRHVEQNIEAMVRCLRWGRPPSDDDLLFVRAPSTRRAHHRIGLADFLHAFRLGLRHIWRSLMLGADDDESRIAALGLVEPVSEYINRASTRVAEVYLEVEQLMALEGEQVRRDLLHALLQGDGPRNGAADAVAAAGLRPGTSFVVISALLSDPEPDPVTVRAAAAAIGRMTTGAATPLTMQRAEEIVGILPVGPGGGSAMAAALADARDKLALQDMPMRIGASTVLSALEQVPAGYREASRMRAQTSARDAVRCMCGLSTFGYLTMAGDDSAVRLIDPEIAAFLQEDEAADGALIETLLAYANADLSVKAMSEHLFIHPNTAHKRLSRIAERTGRDLRRLADVMELVIAIRLMGAARDG